MEYKWGFFTPALEIKTWLQEHPDIHSFVILDDSDYDWGEFENHWVATTFYDENGGLQEERVEKAIQILNAGE